MRQHARRLMLGPLMALLLGGLSCAVLTPAAAPPAEPPARELSPPTVAAPPTAREPAVDAVRAHLLRFRYRSGLTSAELDELARVIVEEARRRDFDPALVLAVMHVESRFDNFAVSSKNALGLMQILPSTGAPLAEQQGIAWTGPQTLFDPIANVRIGVAYLRELTDRYGSLPIALAAYNWGPGRIDHRLRHGAPLPREYAQLVLTAYGSGDRSS